MTYSADVRVDPRRVRGRIDDGIYGQFIEHIGRAIYNGVYEPGSPLADADGYRTDVLEAARALKPSVLRWPGGNFASGYHWRDGIGPVEERPRRRDLAWSNIEDNSFGTEEFLAYCRMLGAAPYLNLNMGTGTADEALAWLEYCNASDAGIPEADERRRGPHPDPHDVPIWGLGNEVYGWWQHGHTSAASYGETAREWGKLLRWTDPSVRLVGVGAPDPDWNWTVLKSAGRSIDYLSLHFYWSGGDDPYHRVIAGPAAAERDIVAAFGMCLAARKALRLARPITIAVDEWGVWYRTFPVGELDPAKLVESGFSARAGIDSRFEEPYDLKDALAVASWLHVLWRHPEKVTLATQAQMVNVIAPILTTPEGLVRHTIFHPLATAVANAGSDALDVAVDTSEEVEAPVVEARSLPALDAAATYDEQARRLHVSLVNRSRTEPCEARVLLPSAPGGVEATELWHDDPFAGNDPDAPDRVVPTPVTVDAADELHLVLKPHSHVTLVLSDVR